MKNVEKLRGSHPGSEKNAHNRAWTGQTDWGPTTDLKEEYDLVVVGGGFGIQLKMLL